MTYNNFLIKQNNQSYKPQKILASVHFNDVSKKLPEKNQQHKDIKYRQNSLAQKKYINATA